MKKKRVGKWSGGYVRRTSSGRDVYVIERWGRNGKRRYHVSTDCSTPDAAKKELERFELDPENYRAGTGAPVGLALTGALTVEYREHQLAAGLSREWVDEVSRCMKAWLAELRGKNLRALDLHRDVKPPLDLWKTQRAQRIKALKGFFRWLRVERGLVDRAHDPTMDLRVPPSRPEKFERRKIVPREDVQRVLKHLVQPTRDVLHLLTATGWHVSEVRRFAEGGELVKPLGAPDVLAVAIVRQKSGGLTKTPLLFPEHLAAAERLRALGKLPKRMTLCRHLNRAIADTGKGAAGVHDEKLEVPWFGLGQIRHSFLTWAVERGTPIKTASEWADHNSEATTKRFYLDLAVPRARVDVTRFET